MRKRALLSLTPNASNVELHYKAVQHVWQLTVQQLLQQARQALNWLVGKVRGWALEQVANGYDNMSVAMA